MLIIRDVPDPFNWLEIGANHVIFKGLKSGGEKPDH